METLLSDLYTINALVDSTGDSRFAVTMDIAKQARELQRQLPGLDEKDAVSWAIRSKPPKHVDRLRMHNRLRSMPTSKYDDLNYIDDPEVKQSIEMSLAASKESGHKTYVYVESMREDDPRRSRVRILVNRLYERVLD